MGTETRTVGPVEGSGGPSGGRRLNLQVLDRLTTELGIGEHAVYRLPGPLDLTGLHAIADLSLPEPR